MTELPESSGDYRNAKKAQDVLTPRLEVAKQKEVDEMMGKLKGLGNSLLGLSDCVAMTVAKTHGGNLQASSDYQRTISSSHQMGKAATR